MSTDMSTDRVNTENFRPLPASAYCECKPPSLDLRKLALEVAARVCRDVIIADNDKLIRTMISEH